MTTQKFSQFSLSRNQKRRRFRQPYFQAVRRLSIESLETRELLTVGSLLHTLDNPTPAAGDRFGGSVALTGQIAAVGAFWDDTSEFNAGAAYLFDPESATLLHSLQHPEPAANDYFGFSIAASGDAILAGAPLKDDTSSGRIGAAYIFDAVSGDVRSTLSNPTPDFGDWFGFSVALSEDVAVVGAPLDDLGDRAAGVAHVFDASSGQYLRTLANPYPNRDDHFGFSVAASGTTVLIGTPLDDVGGARNEGAAYLFDAATGALLHTLENPNARNNYGYSVAVSGNQAIVGAPNDGNVAADAGAAYVFDVETGELLQTLTASAPQSGGGFGYSVASSGNSALVGARFEDSAVSDSGAAYLFDASSGVLQETLHNPTPDGGDQFGLSVALSTNKAMVGAPFDDTLAEDAGAAYLFDAKAVVEIATSVQPNAINLASQGLVSTAIITTDTFDAADVDVSSIVWAGANVAQRNNGSYFSALEDVDGDGDLDLVLHFRLADTDLLDIHEDLLRDDLADGTLDSYRQSVDIALEGLTNDGDAFRGFDTAELFLTGKALRDFRNQRGF